MKKAFVNLIAAILIAAMAFSAVGFASPAKVTAQAEDARKTETAARDPREIVNIIVKMKGAPVLESCSLSDSHAAAESAKLIGRQNRLIASINGGIAKSAPIEPLYQYTLLFNGFAFRGEYALINSIKKLPSVADCYESPVFTLPEKVDGEGEQERLSTSVGFINADDMWALGYSGQGMTIAVIDTGIKTDHPSFAAAPEQPHFSVSALDAILNENELCAEQRYQGTLTGSDLYYSSKIPYTFNYFAGNTDVSHSYAQNDHGTHVSSIAAGNTAGAKGVAYNAQLISMQVFNGGNADWIDIVAALEDCAYLGVDAVNMSLGADCGFTHDEDLEGVFALLTSNGVNVAAASGNAGTAGGGNIFNGTTPTFNYDNGVTSTPASMGGALSVAASLNSADVAPASYSSWGTTSDLRIKPEIMAPGDNIEAAVDPEYSGGYYGMKSGTSMATPHIAGGIALVKQFVKANFPDYTAEETMDMVNTLLMCTAVPADINGVLYSPRQQGAGQADLTAAISTGAYIEVSGERRPKIELGDDDEKAGIFSFSFDVVNFSAQPLTYSVDTTVLTEQINQWLIGYSLVNIMNHAPEDITSSCAVSAPSSVTVPANGRTTVNITVNMNGYAPTINATCPLGMYIEGFVQLHGQTDLSVPFLGFYGDWEYSAVFDRKNYFDQYLGSPFDYPTEWGTNRAAAYMGDETVLFGLNPFANTTNFLLDRASLSPNGDGKMDEVGFVHTYMLRNAEIFRYEVLDADTGEQYFVQDIGLVPKAVKNTWTTFYQPVGAEPWSAMEHWGGAELENGTHCILRMTGFLQGWDEFDPAENEHAVWEVPITIDKEAPQIVSASIDGSELDIAVSDNHYTAFVGVYSNAACTSLIASSAVEENERGMTTELSFDIGSRETVWVKLGDYAGNTVIREIGGSSDDYLLGDCNLNGAVEVTDAILAMRHAMGLITLTGNGLLAGDIDGNGSVSVTDAILIMRYAMGLINEF